MLEGAGEVCFLLIAHGQHHLFNYRGGKEARLYVRERDMCGSGIVCVGAGYLRLNRNMCRRKGTQMITRVHRLRCRQGDGTPVH